MPIESSKYSLHRMTQRKTNQFPNKALSHRGMRKPIAQIIVFTDVYVICKTTSDLEPEALRYKPVRQS